jgi:sulfur carrier protein
LHTGAGSLRDRARRVTTVKLKTISRIIKGGKMKITLNNREEEFLNSTMTVSQLLEEKNYTFKMLVVKVNDKLVKKHDYDSALINEGDNVMVLHLISGG